MYTPGAVSSLIHLETSSTEKSKEQKKLDKLFGWQKTKSPVDPAPAFASPVSSDVSKDISLDFNPPDKKKKKLYKNGDVSSLNVKNECLPKNVKEKKNQHEKDENVDSPFLKKVKKSKEKNPTENEVKKNRKRKKKSEEKKSEFFGNEIEKNDDNEFLSKKKKLKTNEFEKKEEKKVKKLSDKNNNNNNVHGQENSLNSKFSLKGNEINEKEKKKRKKLSDNHNRNNDNNNNVHGQEKALKSKFSIKSNEINTKEENKVKKNLSDKNNQNNNNNNVHGQEKAVNSKVPVINDVLSALQGKDGLKSRKRNPKRRKEKDLSDLEESEEEEEDLMAKKRSKKRKRDKKNDFKTVFVGNLPLTITMKHLKKLFSSSCGEVESVRLRGAVPANPQRGKKYAILKKDFHSKCKSINAYICFCDKQSADKACEVMNGQEVGGQIIRVNSSIIDKKGHDHKRSVFVGNLPFVVTEDDVRKHFLDCGSVVNVRLVKDWKTGIGKGFGYVKFEEVDGAELAVKLDGSKLNKRKIRVYPSEADPKKQKEARDTKRRSLEKTKVGNSRRGGAGGGGGDGMNFEKKGKLKKSDQKEFVGIKAEKKKKKKPKHLARKMGLTSKKKDGVAAAVKPVEKSTGGPNKHMVFE